MTDTTASIVYVTYEGTPDDRFDRAYYSEHHLPLAFRHWGPLGLTRIAVFYPAVAERGTVAIAELHFRDDAAVDAAFASPGTAEVMGDVSKFTDIPPTRLRATAA